MKMILLSQAEWLQRPTRVNTCAAEFCNTIVEFLLFT